MLRTLYFSMLLIPVLSHSSLAYTTSEVDNQGLPITVSITIQVSEHSTYTTELNIRSDQWLTWPKVLQDRDQINVIPISDTRVTITQDEQISSYLIDHHGYLYDVDHLVRINPPERWRTELIHHVEQLRALHYGSLSSWSVMNEQFPKKDIFHVIDLETGLSFRVQRRAGAAHADVQPLTSEDTKVMKDIYSGRWSWKRRAILVGHEAELLKHQLYAASMHGMPHGGDGIPDNQFAGHFCIHFLDSRTHGSGQFDFDHQLMVFKAAGQLIKFYAEATPNELIHSFFSALNQRDEVILRWSFAYRNHPQADFFLQEMRRIASVHIDLDDELDHSEKQSWVRVVLVQTEMYREGEGRVQQVYTFLLMRDTHRSPWRIEHISLVS